VTDFHHFLRTSKRYLPPFRIVYRRSGRGAPLMLKDARNTIVGSFTRWAYAYACLEALYRKAGLLPPADAVAKRRFQEDIWEQTRLHPNSNAMKHYNDTVDSRGYRSGLRNSERRKRISGGGSLMRKSKLSATSSPPN
jgi:hypothetical protein